MKINIVLFWIIAVFMILALGAYVIWNVLETGAVEWVGTVALALTGIFAGFIAFYLGMVHKAQGGALPEDLANSNIDDGDPEIGFYSPWSWWPVVLAGAAAIAFLGFAVGIWITFIGAALVVVALVGWVFEYYRGYFAR